MFVVAFGLAALALIFGGGLLGLALGRVLPRHYMDESTQKVVQITTGTISVMAALVIGLTIAQARNTLASRDQQIEQLAANLAALDGDLARYGADTQPDRALVRQYAELKMRLTWPRDGRQPVLDTPQGLRLLQAIQDRIMALQPKDATQREALADAVRTSDKLIALRWELAVEHAHEVPRAFLFALVFWLTLLFVSFGLFAPGNAMTVASLFLGALCLCIALLLVVDMDDPFHGLGLIAISPYPMEQAITSMGG